MFGWFKSWKERRNLKSLIRQMGSSLRRRYGFQEYYSADQVLKTAEIENLDQEGKVYAVAMYVLPDDAQGVLTKLGEIKLANVVRGYMIGVCMGGFRVYDNDSPSYNVFAHHAHVFAHHTHGHSGGHSDGGHSSGDHSGGDSGGHH